MRYATYRRAIAEKRGERWRRITKARENGRLARALAMGEAVREDRPVGAVAVSGPLFGFGENEVHVLDVWSEDHGDGRLHLFTWTTDGRRRRLGRMGPTGLLRRLIGDAGHRTEEKK